MLETKDLILDKAKLSDWNSMFYNVWCHPESAKYMFWDITTNETDAKARMERTVKFQKNHDMYLVYEKISGQAIGFAGVEEVSPGIFEETGVCLGPKFVRKGYGRQIVECLLEYCREQGAKLFYATAREDNVASNALIQAFGFELLGTEEKLVERDGTVYRFNKYRLEL